MKQGALFDEEYIYGLKARGILPWKLADQMLAAKDINISSEDFTIFNYLAAPEEALKAGADPSVTDKLNRDALMVYISSDNLSAINTLITHLSPDYHHHDHEGNTALHHAALKGNVHLVQTLLKDPRFKSMLGEKNLYEQTPLDLALAEKKDNIVKLFDPTLSDPSKHPQYGKYLAQNQNFLNEKLMFFLELKGRDPTSVIDHNGNCHGWSLLYLIYKSAGKLNEFYEIRQLLQNWDGRIESLKSTPIPENLQHKYQKTQRKGGRKSPRLARLSDVFDHLVNDLAWFQRSSEIMRSVNLGHTFFDDAKVYELVKDKTLNRHVTNLFSFPHMKCSRDQLITLLSYIKRWPNVSVVIGGGKHATALFVNPDGSLDYFEPNSDGKFKTFHSDSELADIIIKFKYRMLGSYAKDGTFDIALTGLFIQDHKSEIRPMVTSSVSKFPLHQAILDNDIERVNTCILNSADVNAFDDRGMTPLMVAVCMDNKDMIEFLLKKGANINTVNKTGVNVFGICRLLDKKSTAQLLLDFGGSPNDPMVCALLRGMGVSVKIPEQLKQDSPLIYAILTQNLQEVKRLANDKKALNQKDALGRYPLLLAILSLNIHIINALLDADADISQNFLSKDQQTSLLDTAMTLIFQQKLPISLFERLLDLDLPIFSDEIDAILNFLPPDMNDLLQDARVRLLQQLVGAIKNEDLSEVKRLMNLNVDINFSMENGETPFSLVARLKNKEMMKLILPHVKKDDPLTFAVKQGDVGEVQKLIAAGANVNKRDSDKMTPMMYAAMLGNQTIINELLSHKANPYHKDLYDKTAYDHACASGFEKMLKDYHSNTKYNEQGQTEFAEVIYFMMYKEISEDEAFKKIKSLVERGVDLTIPVQADGPSAISLSLMTLSQSQINKLESISKTSFVPLPWEKITKLHLAAANADPTVLAKNINLIEPSLLHAQQFQLVEGFSMGEWNVTPLMSASMAGCLDNVKILLDKTQERERLLNYKNELGDSALTIAVNFEQAQIVDFLLTLTMLKLDNNTRAKLEKISEQGNFYQQALAAKVLNHFTSALRAKSVVFSKPDDVTKTMASDEPNIRDKPKLNK